MPIFGWKNFERREQPQNTEIGTGPATKCASCGELLMSQTLKANLGVCPQCDHHDPIGAWERIAITLDEDSFVEHDTDLASKDVLNFRAAKSYADTLQRAMTRTGLLSAIVTGHGLLKARPVAFGVTDSNFAAGSMGSVLGEKLVRLMEYAIEEHVPAIVVSSSGGGARMQEGMYSLMQMAKTSAAVAKLQEAKLPFIVVCARYTMAGVWASWASLPDIIIGEPKAEIGFTGKRVIKTTINCELPDGFQTSEFILEHGQLDMIVHRHEMRDTLASILDKLMGPLAQNESA